jgi:hypothetical protein
MMDLVAWWAQMPSSSSSPLLRLPSCEQQIWSLVSLRIPLCRLDSKMLPTEIREHQSDECSLTSIEIRNSFSPSMPVCIGMISIFKLVNLFKLVTHILHKSKAKCVNAPALNFDADCIVELEYFVKCVDLADSDEEEEKS